MKLKTNEELNIRQKLIFGASKTIADEMFKLMAKLTEEEFKKHTVFNNMDEDETLSFWGKIINVTNAQIFLHMKKVTEDFGIKELDFNKLITDVTNGTRAFLSLPIPEDIARKKPDEYSRIIQRGSL